MCNQSFTTKSSLWQTNNRYWTQPFGETTNNHSPTYCLSVLMNVLRFLARLVLVAFPPNPTTKAVSRALLPPMNIGKIMYRFLLYGAIKLTSPKHLTLDFVQYSEKFTLSSKLLKNIVHGYIHGKHWYTVFRLPNHYAS